MTIDSVTAGDIIDPDWGNSVADQLNLLPEILSVQSAFVSDTTNGAGKISVVYPIVPTAANSSVSLVPFSTGTTLRMVQISQVTSTGFTVVCFNGTSRVLSGNAQFFWTLIEYTS